jgi:hypothetical protein
MTQYHGKDGAIYTGANEIGEVTDFSLDVSVETYQTIEPTLSDPDPWITHAPGARSWTATIEAKYDHGDTNGQEALMADLLATDQTTASFTVYPTGNTSGHDAISGTGVITGLSSSTGIGGIVNRTFTIQGSGALVYSAVA